VSQAEYYDYLCRPLCGTITEGEESPAREQDYGVEGSVGVVVVSRNLRQLQLDRVAGKSIAKSG